MCVSHVVLMEDTVHAEAGALQQCIQQCRSVPDTHHRRLLLHLDHLQLQGGLVQGSQAQRGHQLPLGRARRARPAAACGRRPTTWRQCS